jgi:hypothetical protein
MQNKEMKILQIDRINNLVFYSQENYGLHKSRIYEFLSNFDTISTELTKLFESVFPEWKNDTLNVIKQICTKLITKNKNYLLNDSKSNKILSIFSHKKFSLEFIFNDNNLEELSKLLIKSFHNIDKLYKINKFSIFLQKFYQFSNQVQQNLYSSFIDRKPTNKKENFPGELKELSENFFIVRTLKLQIPKGEFELYIYLLPLLNLNWLFPNLLEVELDLITPIIPFNEDSPEKSIKYIKKNKEKYLLMIFYCYFITLIENLRSLTIKLYECYMIEIEYVLKEMKVLTNDFHFLNFLTNVFNLNKLCFDFNCLDSITFEKLISLIHRNNYLQNVSLLFFPPEEYFSLNHLEKIGSILSVNVNNLTTNSDSRKSITGMDSIIDDNEFILDQIIDFFERNMDRLFFVLRSKEDIINLSLRFNFPNIVSSNDKYLNIFHKFFINLYYNLENPNNMIQTFKFKSSNIFFDAKNNPIISYFLKNLNVSSNKHLKNLTLSLKFFSVLELDKLFPDNIEYISIGDLCLESFSNFSNCFKNNLRKLKYLKVSLNNVYFDLRKHISCIYRFFSTTKPRELEEIYFKSSLPFSHQEIINIIDLINYDHIRRYKFMIAKKNFSKNTLKLPKTYYTYFERRTLYFLLYLFRKKSTENNIYKFHKIFQNFRHYFKQMKQKDIEFKFV